MNDQKHQFEHEHQSKEVQVQLSQQMTDKDLLKTHPEFSRLKRVQRPSQNKIPVQVFRVVLMEDKSLWCPELSRTLPVNHSGALDLDKLAHEIRTDPEYFSLNRHQPLMNK